MVMDIRKVDGRVAWAAADVGRWVVTLATGLRYVFVGTYVDAFNHATSRA
jgi:hypothetical protein